MAKVPGVADVKTRLRPVLTAPQCNALATCFLQDTISDLENDFKNIIVAFTPERGYKNLHSMLSGKFQLTAQRGNSLGERLAAAIGDSFAGGFGPVIVIGTDSPTLPLDYILRAVLHLQKHANGVAIGPTEDGGYYLIGMSKRLDAAFENISWSSDRVFEETSRNIRKSGDVELLILPTWYDVDEPDDLRRLKSEFSSNDRTENRAARTREWLAKFCPPL